MVELSTELLEKNGYKIIRENLGVFLYFNGKNIIMYDWNGDELGKPFFKLFKIVPGKQVKFLNEIK